MTIPTECARLNQNVTGNVSEGRMARVTIKDVAREAQVSINTVSRALNDKPDVRPETREIVLEAAERLGYRPNRLARGLRSSQTGVIGTIVADIANPFFSAVVKGMGEEARAAGYSLVLQDTAEVYANEESAIRTLQAEQVDGVLLTPVQSSRESLRMLREANLPFVLVARHFDDSETNCVVADDVDGGRLATAHLLDRGHRRIGFINGPLVNSSARERLAGYRAALQERGLGTDPVLMSDGALTMEDGYEHAGRLLAEAQPTALFAFSDYVALGAMKAVQEAGLSIPEDVAVVGYDDIDFSSCLQSPLTTVRVPKREIGRQVVRILIQMLKQPDLAPQVVRLPVELIVRDSS